MKKTRILIAILFLSFLFTPALYAQSKGEKIGFVDLSRLFDEYYKTKEFDKVLEGKHDKAEAEGKKKLEEIQEMQGKLALLKDDKKEALQDKIEQKKADLLDFDRQEKTSLTKERNEKIREILLEIEKVVSAYAEKENYSIILNDRVLIYGNQGLDLTEQILKLLNENKPKE